VIFALLYFQTPLEIPGQPGSSPFRTHGTLEDVMLVMAVIFCLLLVLLFWAKYLRKRSRHHSSGRVDSHVIEGEGAGSEGGSHHHRHRRHRRHRRNHRPRNPTLAETGGLPPPRPEDHPPPSA